MTLSAYRRFYAEEIEAACGLRSRSLVEAFATVERERFVGPGPWILKGADGDLLAGAGRATPDADPRRVYHNVAIAIDPVRHLFNGQPSTIGAWIDRLALAPGERVLHVGAGTGYFTAIMAACVGTGGSVVAYEVDGELATRATRNLAPMTRVDVRHGDSADVTGPFDAVLINAGTTHPLDAWLDAIAPGGRMVVPVTFRFGDAPISKGTVVLLTRADGGWRAETIGLVAIFAAVGVRDESLAASIGAALKSNPIPRLSSFRRDGHDQLPSCWLHTERFCFEMRGHPPE